MTAPDITTTLTIWNKEVDPPGEPATPESQSANFFVKWKLSVFKETILKDKGRRPCSRP
jgi:hypothetical protein